jgi:hypothetical protein
VGAPPAANPVSPIDGVIGDLTALIEWAFTQPSRILFFASLYLRVTNTIRSKIGTGYFDDDHRMEVLDATFASRYLYAVQQFRSHDPALPAAWAVALNATARTDLTIVQHLLLSMNPHINIDLAVAAARTCPGEAIGALHNDFVKINAILSGIVPTVISEIGSLSPCLHLISDLSEDGETSIIDFSLDEARNQSWDMAVKLASLPKLAQEHEIANLNVSISALGNKIISPGLIGAAVVAIIEAAEVKDVVRIAQVLNSGNPIAPVSPTNGGGAAPVSQPSPALDTGLQSMTASGKAPNQVYYFDVAPGSWTGSFQYELTSWRVLWSSSMTLKNKLLASAMQIFQTIFGASSISCTLTPHPDEGAFGVAQNSFRIHKSWLTLWRSNETYTLHRDGHRVTVDAHVSFGPIPFLFPEHDVYPASVFGGGMRNIYHIKLLGTRFLGDYHVQPGNRQVDSRLTNEWALIQETLKKL